MRYETFEQWLGELAGQNPMYDIFYGAHSLAFTTAVVLFTGALVAFARKQMAMGFGLMISTAITVVTGIELASSESTSYISLGLGVIAWLATLFMTVKSAAQHTTGGAAMTVSKVLSYLTLMSLTATCLNGMLLDVYYSDELITADNWFWALNLVLIIATVASWLVTWQTAVNRLNRERMAMVVSGTPNGTNDDADTGRTMFNEPLATDP